MYFEEKNVTLKTCWRL